LLYYFHYLIRMPKTVSVKVDDETKSRMELFGDVNWAEVNQY
jgi:hypothetical protein